MQAMSGAASFPERRRALVGLSRGVRLALFATLLGAAAAALWLGPLRHVTRPPIGAEIPWWAELVACYAASLTYIQVRVGRFATNLSLTEIPVAIGLFLVETHVLLGCYAGGVLLAHLTRRGLDPVKDYSNLMLDGLYLAVTVLVFSGIGPDLTGPMQPRSLVALGCAMAFNGWVVGPVALNTGILLYQGRLQRHELARSVLSQVVTTTTNTCLGVLALLMLVERPLLIIALVPPMLLVLLGQIAANESQHRADRMEFLLHVGELLHSSLRVDDRAGDLLTAIIEAFGVSRAELLLVPEARDAALRLTCDSNPEHLSVVNTDLTYAEQEALNALRTESTLSGRLVRTPNSALSLLLAERGASYGTMVSLRGRERPQGMLLLLDPLNGDSPPVGQEADLLLAVARQISVALENGQLAGAIREMSKERDELTRRAFYDPLTQIANRSLFDETVTRALAKLGTSRRPLAILFIDLDGFKQVNDTHGHAVGDEVLTALASRLRAQIRKFDTVARLGGDEFGILLDGLRRHEDVHLVAARVVEALHSPLTVRNASLVVGGSVGVAVVDDAASAPPPEELLRRADMAMYLAKRQGKGRYVVFDTGAREPVIAAAAQPAPLAVTV